MNSLFSEIKQQVNERIGCKMKANNNTITKAWAWTHDLDVGSVFYIRANGKTIPARITCINSATTISIRYLNWFERIWQRLKEMCLLR